MSDVVVGALIALISGVAGALIGAIFELRLSERVRLEAVKPLIEERAKLYPTLWDLTAVGQEKSPTVLTPEKREQMVSALREWYYKNGAGLFLSDNARRQWKAVLGRLQPDLGDAVPDRDARKTDPKALWRSMSCLRTRLKQDLLVHDEDIDESSCADEPDWNVPRVRRRLFARTPV